MEPQHASVGHWSGAFDEDGLRQWSRALREKLRGPVSLGLVFITPKFFHHAKEILELIRVDAQVPMLVGCSSGSLIAGAREIEDEEGIVLGLYSLPGCKLSAVRFTQDQVEEANGAAYWYVETGLTRDQVNGWLALADPFHLDCEAWLRQWNEAYAPLPILGGLASGEHSQQCTQVYLNGDVFEGGGVAVAFSGAIELASVISQGCTPIGETWTITKVNGNIIQEIGNRPAYQVLAETFNALTSEEQQKCRGNLFIGLVVNEYLEEFHRGDFLVRNLVGADPNSGVIAVGALPRAGQTMQFQRRDAATGTEDLAALLQRTRASIGHRRIYGACLCSCNGRGHRMFGAPDHDASNVQQQLGPLGLAGFFCNGEIGPIGEKNFLHGYTASLALFVEKS